MLSLGRGTGHVSGRARTRGQAWRGVPFALLSIGLLLSACAPVRVNPNVLTGIELTGRARRPHGYCDSADGWKLRQCTPELLESLSFARRNTPITIRPVGKGTCPSLTVDFGDGTPPVTLVNQVLDNLSSQVIHTYSGWGGPKRIRATGLGGCHGDVTREITVGYDEQGDTTYDLVYAFEADRDSWKVCRRVPNVPPLRQGTGVRIGTNRMKIVYSQQTPGSFFREFDASGDTSGTTPADFPFPAHRAYSLVYQVGLQRIQGEAGPVVFRAAETAPLEVCVNEKEAWLSDNRGAIGIHIDVNERSATP